MSDLMREDVRVPVGDALELVHHHSWHRYRPSIFGGQPAPTLCGIRSKRPVADAAEIPCCPMCADQLAAAGKSCRVDPEVAI